MQLNQGICQKGGKAKNEKCHLKTETVWHSQGQCADLRRWGGGAIHACSWPLLFDAFFLMKHLWDIGDTTLHL